MKAIRVPLSSRKWPGLYALIDEDDLVVVRGYKWNPNPCESKNVTTIYAYGYRHTEDGRVERAHMHRLVLGVNDPSIFVDHINRDGLDNRKANLRLCTRSQNNQNVRHRKGCSSQFKGVHFLTAENVWAAEISANKKRIRLGRFRSEVDAARAYNDAAIEIHGDFAVLNDLDGGES